MKIWDALLLIKEEFRTASQFPDEISIHLKETTKVTFGHVDGADVYLAFDVEKTTQLNPFQKEFQFFKIIDQFGLNLEERHCLEFYFPYVALPFYGARRNKCFAISHFAQTLDGRIASCTGDSKWIGNEENLVHAHRMRALCDGILVGAKTVTTDNPRLNVRKVKGEDPIKVIIGDADELDHNNYHALGPDTLIYKKPQLVNGNGHARANGTGLDLQKLLNGLKEKQIYSVYIEGGSFTTSSFIKQQQLDQIQLHFAPKVLGAGVNSFSFEGVDQVEDAITFSESKFVPIGDEIMFVGNLSYE